MILSNLLTNRWSNIVVRRQKFLVIVLVLATLIILRKQCNYIQDHCHFEQNHREETSHNNKRQPEVEAYDDNEVTTEDEKGSEASISNSSLPKIVWLMSYPNSGTSFTMHLVSRGGNRSVATNYGLEDGQNEKNIPLYLDSSNGPYVLGSRSKALPTEYILTKTHCGGRCVGCSPEGYIENQTHFLKRCAQGSRKNNSFEDNREFVWYDPFLAKKSIHIVRNPFDNLVSNFHLDMKHKAKKMNNDYSFANKYTGDASAFRNWCSRQDLRYAEKEKQLLPKDVVEFFEGANIPCHAHFYRYAKWHDYVVGVIKELKLPSITVFYEDYETKFNSTVKSIFDFLKIRPVAEIPVFVGGKTYLDFFTKDERHDALAFVKRIVGNDTQILFDRYSE